MDLRYRERWSSLFFNMTDELISSHTKYDMILLGNSRVHFGINPYYLDSASGFSAYNFANGGAGALWRIVLRPSQAGAMLAQLPGRYAIDWGGALIWAEAPPGWAPALRPGERAVRVRGEAASLPAPDPVTARLNAGLRASFDPRGLFGGMA